MRLNVPTVNVVSELTSKTICLRAFITTENLHCYYHYPSIALNCADMRLRTAARHAETDSLWGTNQSGLRNSLKIARKKGTTGCEVLLALSPANFLQKGIIKFLHFGSLCDASLSPILPFLLMSTVGPALNQSGSIESNKYGFARSPRPIDLLTK